MQIKNEETKFTLQEIDCWIKERIELLFITKTKFTEHKLNDWVEIPDYKIAELNNFRREFLKIPEFFEYDLSKKNYSFKEQNKK